MSSKKVFVAGHNGMVGGAICKLLNQDDNIELFVASRDELDLTRQDLVYDYFNSMQFDELYLAAAKVGGIHANNSFPADFIYQNLMILSNVINAAYKFNVKKLLNLGSSCIYPKNYNEPINEDRLLTGQLEETNEPYAIAKIAGIKLCESFNRQYGTDFRSVMPTNLYGPGDNYHPQNSHVVPALIGRIHSAKIHNEREVVIWGSGKPHREFLHVDDLANACLFIMDIPKSKFEKVISPMQSHINIGYGSDISIKALAQLISKVIGFDGELVFDISKPDGTYRKLLNSNKIIDLGWSPKISLEEGLQSAYSWYLQQFTRK